MFKLSSSNMVRSYRTGQCRYKDELHLLVLPITPILIPPCSKRQQTKQNRQEKPPSAHSKHAPLPRTGSESLSLSLCQEALRTPDKTNQDGGLWCWVILSCQGGQCGRLPPGTYFTGLVYRCQCRGSGAKGRDGITLPGFVNLFVWNESPIQTGIRAALGFPVR